ncbi:hypothetical protein ACIPSJ_01710 [Streptomyces sp. NPDC090088]|uniref:hypothetical protein n=1 Tax=Streptomyces sp. NPDC090088 TaxID=3365944 RepID=UPI0038110FE0
MTSRTDTIATALTHPEFRRPFLGQELRGAMVQGLGPGSSEPRWTATVPQLAEAIDTALTRAEEKDTPAGGSTTADASGTADTPHALVIRLVGPDHVGTCECGRAIGRTPRTRSLDGLAGLWEQHAGQATDPDTAWADALNSLPTHTTPIGAS